MRDDPALANPPQSAIERNITARTKNKGLWLAPRVLTENKNIGRCIRAPIFLFFVRLNTLVFLAEYRAVDAVRLRSYGLRFRNPKSKSQRLKIMSSVYFGGSRNPSNINPAQVAQVVGAVVAAGQAVHVGCQFGADQAVVNSACFLKPSALSVFLVAAHHSQAPHHTMQAGAKGASVTFSAGGTSAPMPARYLLRSIAAFQGCSQAVFFSPGAGSLAVAREALKAGLPVFAFQQAQPARVPSSAGSWVASSFMGFACWQWQAPSQPALF